MNKKSFKIVFDYSLFFFLFFVSVRVIFAVDSLLIGYFLGTAAITFYAVPQRLVEYIRLVVMGTGVFQPTVSHMQALNQNDKNSMLMSLGTKYVMMIALPISAAYIIIGEQFLNLWVGNKYSIIGYPVLIVLTIGIIGHLTQHIAIQVLQGLAKHGLAAFTSVLQALISIFLIIYLMDQHGTVGVAVGKTIPMIIFNFVFIPWYTCRLLKLSYWAFLGEALITPLLAVLVFSITLFLFSHFFIIHTWTIFLMDISIAIITYLICTVFFCFSKQERIARFQQLRHALNIAR